MNFRRIGFIILGQLLISTLGLKVLNAAGVSGPHEKVFITAQDTIPFEDRYGDFITDDTYNPFDIQTSEIEQVVEFDLQSGNYLIYEKIGDEFFRTPMYLTMEEYLEYTQKKQQREQFLNLAGIQLKEVTFRADADPILALDLEDQLTDRLFGGIEVDVKPTGYIEFGLGGAYNDTDNPTVPLESRRRLTLPEVFGPDINVGLDGQIGDKLNLDFDYNSLASFDFDQYLNFAYNSEDFDEDDIIKRIEAGNVQLPLRSQLIKGSEDLFGLLTEVQFGKFRMTGLVANQQAEQKNLSIQNGSVVQEFELTPDEYDENRHFFVSHYNRNQYEESLTRIPQIRSRFRITNIEVWVTNDQNSDLQNSTTIAAIDALGDSPGDVRLPNNANTDLFGRLVRDDATRSIVNASTRLNSVYGLTQVKDFEVQTMRQLRPTEFTYHPQLGYISLNVRLRPNQVLGVAYEYTDSSNPNKIFKVGELSNETNSGGINERNEPEPKDVLYVKMLKSSNQRTDIPSWDLMMKNVYSIPTSTLNEDDFTFEIYFQDFATNTLKRYIPEESVRNTPLMNLFKMDQLNSYGDPQQDGIFDYISGITINAKTGSIIFPVLEPFGESLKGLLGDSTLYNQYGFESLYRGSVTSARQNLDNNRFVMKGEFKSDASSEIYLGGFRIPEGSVTVRAGSQELVENVDYEIDYGAGRLKILNEGYIQQGIPIDVSFEDKSLFVANRKTMLGLRGDYQVSDNFNWGFTYMRLFERPFTQKVNYDSDPINNRILGLDLNFSTEAPFITKFLDRLPLISTKEKSSISLTGELAALKPGHAKAINIPDTQNRQIKDADGNILYEQGGGVVSIDDFEGANSSLSLGFQSNLWVLASTPVSELFQIDRFPEAKSSNNVEYGANRALLNWYTLRDRIARNGIDNNNPYTRLVQQTELFNRQLDIDQLDDVYPFDLIYYPDERGPYNFDPPEGIPGVSAGAYGDDFSGTIKLNNPEERWAGVMRYLPNNDFEASNFEYIDFWMLNPFIDAEGFEHDPGEEGSIFFNLGNVSEDVLKDNLQFYENSIATPGDRIPSQPTVWGEVPLSIPNVDGFDNQDIDVQDLGFDGINDAREAELHADYINKFAEAREVLRDDPSNDNFVSYSSDIFDQQSTNILTRLKRFNNPQGNVPSSENRIRVGNPEPDKEDLNDNRSLETSESYYEYEIKLRNNGGEIDVDYANGIAPGSASRTPIITDFIEDSNSDKWYRFRIPVRGGRAINEIEGFRSIQFMRLYMTGFETKKAFRMADLELVRNQWRTTPSICGGDNTNSTLIIDQVSFEENGDKEPFNYVLPEGIIRERFQQTFRNVFQDEKSLNLQACNLVDSCEVSINNLRELDLRQYKRLQMFVHAEVEGDQDLEDGDATVFVRFGKDFNNNYYEYELPLAFSREERLPEGGNSLEGSTYQREYENEVWRDENMFDFPLELFTDIKKQRNISNASITERYSVAATALRDSLFNPNGRVSIKGNPSLGYGKTIMIGIRNPNGGAREVCANVWVNELRLNGLNEKGSLAGIGRLDIQLADLGNVTASASYSSVGFGQLENKLSERSLEENIEYDIATNLELGKLFPENFGLSVPFYYQYAKSIENPKYDQYELDLTVDEVVGLTEDAEEQAEIRDRNKKITKIKTLNFTNVRKDKNPKIDERRQADGKEPRKPKPWDISNFSASYAFTETEYKDEFIRKEVRQDHRGSLDYGFNANTKYIEPFKNLKSKPLRFIKEINFNPFPNSYTFNTEMRRLKGEKLYRVPEIDEGFEYFFNDQKFDWTRNYGLQWDLTKSLRVSYDASALAAVDELRQVGIAQTRDQRDWQDALGNISDEQGLNYNQQVDANGNLPKETIRDNIRDFGRMKDFNQGISINYTLPFKYLPGMDWITARAQYDGSYTWTAGSLLLNNPNPQYEKNPNPDLLDLPLSERSVVGNVIQNTRRIAGNATFALDKLYDKIPYIKNISKKPRRRSTRTRTGAPRAANNDRVSTRNKAREASTIEKIFVRPLLAVREFKFTYSRDQGTIIPGFIPEPKYLGNSSAGAPGYDFAFGSQPNFSASNSNNYLQKADANGWLSKSAYLNEQIIQTDVKNFEGKFELEPWPDVKIDVSFRKTFEENMSLDYLYQDSTQSFQRIGEHQYGSFEVSYWGLSTLFNNDINGIFDQFQKNRAVVSDRLRESNPDYPGIAGPNLPHDKDGALFNQGYGRQNSSVVVPAFLAAYTGESAESVALDLTSVFKNDWYIPKPSWDLRYNGLGKIPFLKDIISSASITHGYDATLRVSSYQEDLQFLQYRNSLVGVANPTLQADPLLSNRNFFSRYEVPDIVISESFVPIIGIDIKTNNEMTINMEYAKTRNLQLSTGLGQLTEGKTTDYIFGFGWTVSNVNIPFLTGRKIKLPSIKARIDTKDGIQTGDKEKEEEKKERRGVSTEENPMVILFNVAYRDDVQFIHELDSGKSAEPTRGTRSLQIQPSFEYTINENFTLTAFFDYSTTRPRVSGSFPVTSIQGGFRARFNLN